jgi:sulfonate transport system ATP-binding protein
MKLNIHSLFKNYTGTDGAIINALRDCSLEIESGNFTVIVGKSGCGKTTLLKIIAALEQADSGTVDYFEAGKKPKIGFMFQDPRLLPWLTVEQNLTLAFPRLKNKAEKIARNKEIKQVLSMTGLADRAASFPAELSGGMAQRAALARCLCRKPEILLLDEPLCSLDTFTRQRLRAELEKVWLELKLTVILVTHDIEEAVFFGDKVLLMNNGTIKSEVPIPLPRSRDCRSAEFQKYCSEIDAKLCAAG